MNVTSYVISTACTQIPVSLPPHSTKQRGVVLLTLVFEPQPEQRPVPQSHPAAAAQGAPVSDQQRQQAPYGLPEGVAATLGLAAAQPGAVKPPPVQPAPYGLPPGVMASLPLAAALPGARQQQQGGKAEAERKKEASKPATPYGLPEGVMASLPLAAAQPGANATVTSQRPSGAAPSAPPLPLPSQQFASYPAGDLSKSSQTADTPAGKYYPAVPSPHVAGAGTGGAAAAPGGYYGAALGSYGERLEQQYHAPAGKWHALC